MKNKEVRMIYPRIEIVGEKRVIPYVVLPKNYRDLVPDFYKYKGIEEVEEYSDVIRLLTHREMDLVWHDELGLTHLSVGTAGFDLDEERGRFVEHNLWTLEQVVPIFSVATKYVSLLL